MTNDISKLYVAEQSGAYQWKCTKCDFRCFSETLMRSHVLKHSGVEV